MTRRNRVLWFGGSVLAIVLGAVVGGLIGGVAGEAVTVSLDCIGGIAIVSAVFFEVGRSEDRERAREQRAAEPAAPRGRLRPPPRRRRRPG
jgi:predicted MFS family arabinose efflux permease